ncbi:MAG: hypothetical protein VW378_08075 [bacterium]
MNKKQLALRLEKKQNKLNIQTKNYQNEWVEDASVTSTTAGEHNDYVRVFSQDNKVGLDENLEKGRWMMLKSDIVDPQTGKTMSATKIQNKYSIRDTPTHIQKVVPEKDTLVKVGKAAGKKEGNTFGDGGGMQFQLQVEDKDLDVKWFGKAKKLND